MGLVAPGPPGFIGRAREDERNPRGLRASGHRCEQQPEGFRAPLHRRGFWASLRSPRNDRWRGVAMEDEGNGRRRQRDDGRLCMWWALSAGGCSVTDWVGHLIGDLLGHLLGDLLGRASLDVVHVPQDGATPRSRPRSYTWPWSRGRSCAERCREVSRRTCYRADRSPITMAASIASSSVRSPMKGFAFAYGAQTVRKM